MRTTEPSAEFIAALAECMGGELIQQENERLPCIAFDSPRCQLHIGSSWQARPKWRASIRDHEGRNVHNSASANFNGSRPLEDIAQDLGRRVLAASHPALIKHGVQRAADQSKAREVAAQIERLETVLGARNNIDGYRHNAFIRLPGFWVSSEYNFGQRGSGCFSADVTVHSFDCLLMIARLVAEDSRIHKQLNPPQAE